MVSSSLSPDGQWIAGTGPGEQICVWAVETLESTCATVNEQPDRFAIVWSPDSTAIAWTHPSTMTLADSDLYVMEVPEGAITNLTDDQVDAPVTSMEEQQFPGMVVDLAPAWSPDSESIVFSRLEWGESGATTAIYSVSRAGGDPEFIYRPEADEAWTITYPMRVLSDGAILYAVTASGVGPYIGIWLLPSGGEPQLVMPGTRDDDFPAPIIVDVLETPEGTIISGASFHIANAGDFSRPVAFQLDLTTGGVTPGEVRTSPVTFSPDGGATLHEGELGAIVITSGGTRSDLGNLGGSPYALIRGIDWATNNTFLLPQNGYPSILVTIAPRQA
jgi:Tol biopolymer transport system component